MGVVRNRFLFGGWVDQSEMKCLNRNETISVISEFFLSPSKFMDGSEQTSLLRFLQLAFYAKL